MMSCKAELCQVNTTLLAHLHRSGGLSLDTLRVLRGEAGPGSSVMESAGDRRLAVSEAGGPDLGAGEVVRVGPVHLVGAVVVHVDQLVGQDSGHLLLGPALAGAHHHLVVCQVVPSEERGQCWCEGPPSPHPPARPGWQGSQTTCRTRSN